MTDYNYNEHRVNLDASDSSHNRASDLGGYSLDLQRRADWPGTSVDPTSQRLDTHRMLDLADKIDNCATAIQQGGASQILQKASASFGPDAWQAAVHLKSASDSAAGLVSQYATELVGNLQAAAKAIRSAAGGYSAAENSNKTGIQNQAGNQAYSQTPATM